MRFIGDYCTIVSSDCNPGLRERACFARVLDRGTCKESYTLIVCSKGRYGVTNHYCSVNKEQILSWIKTLKKVHPFSYKIKNIDYEGHPAFQFDITIEGTYTQRLFVLIGLRYIYEFPFNMALSEAFRLHAIEEYKWINTISLTHFVLRNLFEDYGYDLHSLAYHPKYARLKEIKSKLKRARRVHDSFTTSDFYVPGNEYARNTSEFWESSNEFAKRLKLYRKNLKEYENFWI
jgi:hypothetical protein